MFGALCLPKLPSSPFFDNPLHFSGLKVACPSQGVSFPCWQTLALLLVEPACMFSMVDDFPSKFGLASPSVLMNSIRTKILAIFSIKSLVYTES